MHRRNFTDGAITATGVPVGLLSIQGCEDILRTVITGVLIGLSIQFCMWLIRRRFENNNKRAQAEMKAMGWIHNKSKNKRTNHES